MTIDGNTIVVAGAAVAIVGAVMAALWRAFNLGRDVQELREKLNVIVNPTDPKKGTIPELAATVDDVCERQTRLEGKVDQHGALDSSVHAELRAVIAEIKNDGKETRKTVNDLNDTLRAFLLREQRRGKDPATS